MIFDLIETKNDQNLIKICRRRRQNAEFCIKITVPHSTRNCRNGELRIKMPFLTEKFNFESTQARVSSQRLKPANIAFYQKSPLFMKKWTFEIKKWPISNEKCENKLFSTVKIYNQS